jgi:transcriptional regulator with XRE-family HTH domain
MGITPQAISNWERGETLPHAEDYSAVAAAYEVAPEVLALEVMRLAQASAA